MQKQYFGIKQWSKALFFSALFFWGNFFTGFVIADHSSDHDHHEPALEASVVVSEDGSEVLIYPDGSWELNWDDQVANLPDGRQIQLHADGTWSLTGESGDVGAVKKVAAGAAKKTSTKPVVEAIPAEEDLRYGIELREIIIEIAKDRRTTAQKNAQVNRQTLVEFFVTLPESVTNNIAINENDFSRFTIEDSRGKNYKVIEITPIGGNFIRE